MKNDIFTNISGHKVDKIKTFMQMLLGMLLGLFIGFLLVGITYITLCRIRRSMTPSENVKDPRVRIRFVIFTFLAKLPIMISGAFLSTQLDVFGFYSFLFGLFVVYASMVGYAFVQAKTTIGSKV